MTIAAVLAAKGGDVISVGIEERVAGALALLAERRIGAVPVLDGGQVAGIFSERDVLYCLHRDGAAMLDKRVAEAMTAPAITASPEMGVLTALGLMTARRIRHLPVIAGERLAGFVSIGDLVKFRMDRIEAESRALRDYIQTA